MTGIKTSFTYHLNFSFNFKAFSMELNDIRKEKLFIVTYKEEDSKTIIVYVTAINEK